MASRATPGAGQSGRLARCLITRTGGENRRRITILKKGRSRARPAPKMPDEAQIMRYVL
jgi:hypothetical protein